MKEAKKRKPPVSVRKRGPARIAQVKASKARKDASIIGAITKGRGFTDVPAFLQDDRVVHPPLVQIEQPRDYAPGQHGIFYPHGFKHAEPRSDRGTHRRTGFLLCVLSALIVAAFFVWLGA